MKKKPHGHYCRVCQQYKANEKFSGRGHAAHICKSCAGHRKKPADIEPEPLALIERDDLDEYGLLAITDIDTLPFIEEEEPPKPKKRKRKPNKEKLLRSAQKKQAKALLSEMLKNGEVKKSVITSAAYKAGIPDEALRRAKGSLKVTYAYTGDGAVWRLPVHKR